MIILYYIGIIFLGLIVGSFINVIVYRLPIMMKEEWRRQSHEFLNQSLVYTGSQLTLSLPRSHCPHCKTPLKIAHNIPLLSFFFLKGCCGYCHQKISWRYPIIECLTALAAACVFFHFGLSWAMGFAFILSAGLIAISVIDIQEQFIPDTLTYSLLWLGLLANAFSLYTSPTLAILGVIVGYASFWIIAKLFLWIRKKEGLGYGDFKLLAMLGAWLGIDALLNIILIASLLGLCIGILYLLKKKSSMTTHIPFGPFLAIAGWCTMLFGVFTR